MKGGGKQAKRRSKRSPLKNPAGLGFWPNRTDRSVDERTQYHATPSVRRASQLGTSGSWVLALDSSWCSDCTPGPSEFTAWSHYYWYLLALLRVDHSSAQTHGFNHLPRQTKHSPHCHPGPCFPAALPSRVDCPRPCQWPRTAPGQHSSRQSKLCPDLSGTTSLPPPAIRPRPTPVGRASLPSEQLTPLAGATSELVAGREYAIVRSRSPA